MTTEVLLVPVADPSFTPSLPAYTTNTYVHPETFNPVHQTLLDNDQHLLDRANQTQRVAQDLADRLQGVEQTSAVDVSRSLELDWLYRGNRIAIEFFNAATTLVAHPGVAVLSGISGDDSLDVENTQGFLLGGDYLLKTPAANAESDPTAELVRVAAILSDKRLRLTRNLAANYGPQASLGGSTLQPRAGGGVHGTVSAQWVSGLINLGETPMQRAVVIRRSVSAGEVRLFYRDAYQQDWSERFWSSRRSTGGAGSVIPAGFADYEYVIPMRGDGRLRIEVDGEPVDILHIVAIGTVTGLGGYINPAMRPAAPVVVNPAANAQNVTERPTLSADGYASPAGNGFAAAQFQISTTADFAVVRHDSGEVPAMSYPMLAGVLAANTTYYVRSRVKDVAGLLSDWSAATGFKTLTTYAYVATPSVASPAAGQVDVPEQPTFQIGAFAAVGQQDGLAASQWQIRLASGSWTSLLHDSGEDAVNKTSYVVPRGVLQSSQTQYVMRARQKGTALGWSEWSSDIAFTTKQQFANVLGIVLAVEGGGAGTWVRIDENFKPMTTGVTTFANHPVYAGIVDQTIDGQAMVKLPKFYVKTGLVPSGTYAGKRYWMVSDQLTTGFVLHPAFKSKGLEINQFWMSKYQAVLDGTKLASVSANMTPKTGLTFATYAGHAAQRNVGGVSGFQVWDIYQLAAIQVLALIEIGGSDVQNLIGHGVAAEGQQVNVNSRDLLGWRGITGLWGNIFQMIDGLRTDAATSIQVWDTEGHQTFKPTTHKLYGTWPISMSMQKGADYDLSFLFIAETTSSSQLLSSFPDNQSGGANGLAWVSGYYNRGSDCGLFFLNFGYDASKSMGLTGTRLSKI